MSTASGTAAQNDTDSTPPWWAAFPEPKAPCHRLEPADVMQLLESHSSLGPHFERSFLLVDVRRTDWEGGTVATSINLPAHTLYQTRPVIYQLCKQAGIKTIIFYCGKGFDARARAGTSRTVSLTIRRKLEWSGPEVCGLDAGLPQRGGRGEHHCRNLKGWSQRLAKGVRRQDDGLL